MNESAIKRLARLTQTHSEIGLQASFKLPPRTADNQAWPIVAVGSNWAS